MIKSNLSERPIDKPWSILEAAEFLGCSQQTIFKLMRDGRIATITILRRRYIPDHEMRRLAREGCK